jgi:hypothetical protein
MNNASNSVKKVKSVLDNVYVSGAVKIFIILYAALAAPQLPAWMAKLFHRPLFQVLMFVLIAYTATKDIGVSLLLAVAFFVSFHAYTRHLLGSMAGSLTSVVNVSAKDLGSLVEEKTDDDNTSAASAASSASAFVQYAKLDTDPVKEALAREAAHINNQ